MRFIFPVAAQVPSRVALRSAQPHYGLYPHPRQTSATEDDRAQSLNNSKENNKPT